MSYYQAIPVRLVAKHPLGPYRFPKWRCAASWVPVVLLPSISIFTASCYAAFYLERSTSAADCGGGPTSVGKPRDIHTFNSILLSTGPAAIMPSRLASSRMYSSGYSQTRSTSALPQAACPRPRHSSFQALDLTPGPAPHRRGEASPVAQLVRCLPRQDRGRILTVPLVGAGTFCCAEVPFGPPCRDRGGVQCAPL